MTSARRLLLVQALLGVLGVSSDATAQETKSGKIAKIGRLSPLSAEADASNLAAFRRGMRDLGWVEGRDFVIEARFGDGKAERLPELAAQLVRQNVDLILVGSNPGTLVAKKATSVIPIVMVTTGDPVAGGLVTSLAQPGANVTGLTALGQALSAKRLELLKQAVPGVTRIAVIVSQPSPYTATFLKERESLARALGVQLQVVDVDDPGKFELAFADVVRERAEALMVLTDALFITHRKRLVELAAKSRLPAVYPEREFVSEGGLMFYGASLVDMYYQAAGYTDKILKGRKPADLPVEQPTKLDLVINLKTAKALGLTIPSSVLVRADQIVQ